MATIYDVVTPSMLGARWSESVDQREPYLGEAFFTVRKQLGVELSYLKGKRPLVKPLNLSTFDAKVIPLSREAFQKVTTEMPFFKNSKNIDEKQRQELNKVLATNNQAYIDSVVNEIYNDQEQLLNNADVTKEIMRMNLLTSGVIAFANNGTAVSYDFGIPSANKVTPTVDWDTVATADPIADIIGWQDAIETATGLRPTNLLMNLTTFNKMKKVEAIKNDIYILGQGKVTPNATALKEHILNETGCTVYIYSKGYTNDEGDRVPFVANDCVVLFPDGAVGEFVYGTTPEESDLMSGATNAIVEIVDTGVAITSSKEVDPVNVMTKVSMIALPTLNAPDTILIATV